MTGTASAIKHLIKENNSLGCGFDEEHLLALCHDVMLLRFV